MNWSGQWNDSKKRFWSKSVLENCNLFYTAWNGIFQRHGTFWFRQGHLCLFFFPLVIELRMLSGKERKKINSFFCSPIDWNKRGFTVYFLRRSGGGNVMIFCIWHWFCLRSRVDVKRRRFLRRVDVWTRISTDELPLTLSRGEQIIWDHAHHIRRRMWKIRSKLCSNLLNNPSNFPRVVKHMLE